MPINFAKITDAELLEIERAQQTGDFSKLSDEILLQMETELDTNRERPKISIELQPPFLEQKKQEEAPFVSPAQRGEIRPLADSAMFGSTVNEAVGGQVLGDVAQGIIDPVASAGQAIADDPKQAAITAAQFAVPAAMSTVGSAVGGTLGMLATPAGTIAGTIAGGAFGQLTGEEILDLMGIPLEEESSISGALGTETVATAATPFVRWAGMLATKKIPFVGNAVYDRVLNSFGTSKKFIPETDLEKSIDFKNGGKVVKENVTEALSKLEGEEGLTLSQKTGRQAGLSDSQDVARSTQKAEFDSNKQSALRRSNERFLEEREANILRGGAGNVVEPASLPEDLRFAYNEARKKLTKDIETLNGQIQTLKLANEKQTFDVDGSLGFDFESAFETWIKGQEASSGVTTDMVNSLRTLKTKFMEKVPSLKPDGTPLIVGADGISPMVTHKAMPMKNMTEVITDINNLRGNVNMSADNQAIMEGILTDFEKEFVEKILFSNDAGKEILKIQKTLAMVSSKRGKLDRNAILKSIRDTPMSEGKRLAGETPTINKLMSSRADYKGVKNLLIESGETETLDLINNLISQDILLKSMGAGGKLSSKKMKKNILDKPDVLAVMEEAFGTKYVNDMRRVQLVLEARESDPVMLQTIHSATGIPMEELKERAVTWLGAKVAGHTLQAAGVMAGLMKNTVKNILGIRQFSDAEILRAAQQAGLSRDKMIEIESITDPVMFQFTNALLKNLQVKPLLSHEWETATDAINSGMLDTVPREFLETLKEGEQ